MTMITAMGGRIRIKIAIGGIRPCHYNRRRMNDGALIVYVSAYIYSDKLES